MPLNCNNVSQAGYDNSAPIIGTGQSLFTEVGVLRPKTLFKGSVRLQTFGEYSKQKFDRFGNYRFTYWSAGGNIYLDGHYSRYPVNIKPGRASRMTVEQAPRGDYYSNPSLPLMKPFIAFTNND